MSWIGLLIAYNFSHSRILLFAWIIALAGYFVWRLIPQRSGSCELPGAPPANQSKNATD